MRVCVCVCVCGDAFAPYRRRSFPSVIFLFFFSCVLSDTRPTPPPPPPPRKKKKMRRENIRFVVRAEIIRRISYFFFHHFNLCFNQIQQCVTDIDSYSLPSPPPPKKTTSCQVLFIDFTDIFRIGLFLNYQTVILKGCNI